MKTALSVWWRWLSRAAIGVAVIALLPYAWSPIYRFPDAVPFSGHQLWNPYQAMPGTWQRANLHAHGRAWAGFTSGAQPDSEITARYHQLGYSVAGVSNYMSIAAFRGIDSPPLYEHGFNIGKTHQLAIGARSVDWIDFLFWQTLSNQQYVIDRVRAKADLVSLNHPSSRAAYDIDGMRSLTGYQLVEVVNGPFTAEDVWDAALSAGRPVWAVANDDTHDLTDPRRTAAGWNMIGAASASTPAIIDALRTGRFYAVLRTGTLDGANATTLGDVTVTGATMHVSLIGSPSTITFIGQDGGVRATHKDAQAADYEFLPGDTYVRTVVTAPQTTMYLNPVIRWNGSALPSPAATVNSALTWTQRGGLVLCVAAVAVLARARRVSGDLSAQSLAARRA